MHIKGLATPKNPVQDCIKFREDCKQKIVTYVVKTAVISCT